MLSSVEGNICAFHTNRNVSTTWGILDDDRKGMRWPAGPDANETRPHLGIFLHIISNHNLILNSYGDISFKLDKKD
jgi:hypothetical protein